MKQLQGEQAELAKKMIGEPSYTPLDKNVLHQIKAGDVIERMLAFCIPVYIIVESVTEDRIISAWEFDRNTGLEIDEDISTTVSYIRRVLTEEQKEYLNQGNKTVPL